MIDVTYASADLNKQEVREAQVFSFLPQRHLEEYNQSFVTKMIFSANSSEAGQAEWDAADGAGEESWRWLLVAPGWSWGGLSGWQRADSWTTAERKQFYKNNGSQVAGCRRGERNVQCRGAIWPSTATWNKPKHGRFHTLHLGLFLALKFGSRKPPALAV